MGCRYTGEGYCRHREQPPSETGAEGAIRDSGLSREESRLLSRRRRGHPLVGAADDERQQKSCMSKGFLLTRRLFEHNAARVDRAGVEGGARWRFREGNADETSLSRCRELNQLHN